MPNTSVAAPASSTTNAVAQDIVETRLWLPEHAWLYALLRSSDNVAPTFRFPDLLSGCVALLFERGDAPERIYGFLRTELMLRAPDTPRRRESLWRPQFEMLHALQCSPLNRHPHPKFQLDQLTTACVALCLEEDAAGAAVLRQARHNMVQRHRMAHSAPPP